MKRDKLEERDSRTNYTDQQKGENDASYKEPTTNIERDEEAAIDVLAVCEDLIRPALGRQHGSGGEDIGDIDQEGLQDDDV